MSHDARRLHKNDDCFAIHGWEAYSPRHWFTPGIWLIERIRMCSFRFRYLSPHNLSACTTGICDLHCWRR